MQLRNLLSLFVFISVIIISCQPLEQNKDVDFGAALVYEITDHDSPEEYMGEVLIWQQPGVKGIHPERRVRYDDGLSVQYTGSGSFTDGRVELRFSPVMSDSTSLDKQLVSNNIPPKQKRTITVSGSAEGNRSTINARLNLRYDNDFNKRTET